MLNLKTSGVFCLTIIFSAIVVSCSTSSMLTDNQTSNKKSKTRPVYAPNASTNVRSDSAATRESGSRPSPTQASRNSDAAAEYNEDLRVLPPEVVSGAYLTCNFIPPAREDVNSTYYGCGVMTQQGQSVNLRGLRKTYELVDLLGSPIKAEIKETESSHYDQIWRIGLDQVLRGIKASLTLTDKNNQVFKMNGAPLSQETYPEFLFRLLSEYLGKALDTVNATYQLAAQDRLDSDDEVERD